MSENVAKIKAFQTVLDWVEEEIVNDRLAVGSKLPGERELAARLNVSRSAVREAIRVLEAQGVVEANVGTGPAAGTHITSNQGFAISKLLRIQVCLANIPSSELLEIRIALERTSVAMAAQKATPEQLAQLEKLVKLMSNHDASFHDFNTWDTQFHVTIAQATNNQLLADLTAAIRESLHIPISKASTKVSHYSKYRSNLVKQHKDICNAILRHDVKAAKTAIDKHIRWAAEALQLSSEIS